MLRISLFPFVTRRYHKGCFNFAFHREDPTSENDFKQHTFRGSRSILLLNNMDKKQINETGWKSFVFQNRNVRLICLVRRTSYSHSLKMMTTYSDGDFDGSLFTALFSLVANGALPNNDADND